MQGLLTVLTGSCLLLLAGCASIQRSHLFYPTHHEGDNGLSVWEADARLLGYSREVEEPENVWLMLHGNAGQAADRAYAIPSFSERDSVFILEYPGYGRRSGQPSRASFDAAAIEAYALMRKAFPNTPLGVVGESIGSGPACVLASQSPPPDKIVLVVPFDKLTSLASHHAGSFPVALLLEARWDNSRSLSGYKGRVDIFGARGDAVIPIEHARKLAEAVPSARFYPIRGGHNDWSRSRQVEIRYP